MYKGRFAPSPTGPLHFGSLVAALASYLDARAAGGEWIVRMEDVDTPRSAPNADINILQTLEAFGFQWSAPVVYQGQRTEMYRAALERLKKHGVAYACSCSRREAGAGIYPGTCREGAQNAERPLAWRIRTDGLTAAFEDRVFGHYRQHLARDVGDFVVLRSDGLFAYQLAVVVDDAAQRITDVVRGADLLDSTPRQLYLQHLLQLPRPRYLHVPVVTNEAGEKLSKQTFAPTLNARDRIGELRAALRFLGQPDQEGATPSAVLQAATIAWNPQAIPRRVSATRE